MSVLDGSDSFISFLPIAAAWQRMIQSGSQPPSARGSCPTWWDALFEGPVDSPHTDPKPKGDRGGCGRPGKWQRYERRTV